MQTVTTLWISNQFDSHGTTMNFRVRFPFGNAGVKSAKSVFYDEVSMKSWH